jgi:acetyl esterase/lipase
MERNADADFGDRALLYGWFVDYVPDVVRDPRVFAIDAKLEGLPPLLIQAGGAELLLDQIELFAGQASFLPEGARSMEEIARFLRDRVEN